MVSIASVAATLPAVASWVVKRAVMTAQALVVVCWVLRRPIRCHRSVRIVWVLSRQTAPKKQQSETPVDASVGCDETVVENNDSSICSLYFLRKRSLCDRSYSLVASRLTIRRT